MAQFKFPMHDLHLNKSLKHIKLACIYAVSSAVAVYAFHSAPRKMKYRAFYAKYDPIVSFERMADGGYLSSCPPTGNVQKRKDAERAVKEEARKKAEQKKKDEQKKREERKKG